MKEVLVHRLLRGVRTSANKTNLFNNPPLRHNNLVNNINNDQISNYLVPPYWWSSFYSSSSSSSGGLVAGKADLVAGKADSVAGVKREPVPKHVTIIFDGNRTWCKSKGIPITYKPLCDASVVLAQLCAKWGIPFASSLLFMSDNWRRSKEWQDNILGDFQKYFEDSLELFMSNKFRVSVIGEMQKLPQPLLEVIKHVEETTNNNKGVDLIFSVNYGGRSDIIQATRKISEKVKDELIKSEDINEALFEKELWTNINGRVLIPNPDLLIRVGGPTRLSNHMLWQMAYTELYFNEDIYAPDFGEEEFIKALLSFQNRIRKFGL